MRRLCVVAVGLALALTGCGESTAPVVEPGGLALVGGQLIDGTGSAPVADSVIVIRDGRIESAGSRDTTAVPAGAEVIDVTGKTIIPDLVNLHVHYRGGPEDIERQFRSQLYYGVTTGRSIGSDPPEAVAFLLEANAVDRAFRARTLLASVFRIPTVSMRPVGTHRRQKKRRGCWSGTRSHLVCISSRCGSTRCRSQV